MQFETWSAFFNMGGYAFYVWLSFGVTALVMTGLVAQSLITHRQLLKQVVSEKRRQQRIKQAQQRAASLRSSTVSRTQIKEKGC